MSAAHGAGTVVSFDLNYRPSLWDAVGGAEAAAVTNRRLVENVDVLLGNEEDFSAALGFELEGVDESHTNLDAISYGGCTTRCSPPTRISRSLRHHSARRTRQRSTTGVAFAARANGSSSVLR